MRTKRTFLLSFVGALILASICFVMNFKAVKVNAEAVTTDEIVVLDGMSVRTTEPEGLRFIADVKYSDEDYAASGITEVGMIMLPTKSVVGELTLASENVLVVPTLKWMEEEENDLKRFASVLIANGAANEFPSAFYNTPISGRAYVKYGDDVKYSVNTESRSIGYVASLCRVSGETGYDNAVIIKIANATEKVVSVSGGNTLAIDGGAKQATFTIGGITPVISEKVAVSWSVEGSAVTVSDSGLVTPVSAGNATLIATLTYDNDNEKTIVAQTDVTVDVPTENLETQYFALKQTDNGGNIVNNDFTYTFDQTLTVTGVSIEETAVGANNYSVDGTTITIDNSQFTSLTAGSPATVIVKTATKNYALNIGKIATFAVTKASDINTGSSSVVAPMMVAGGVPSNVDNPANEKAQWTGYIVLANDIDFDGANIVHKCMTANAYGGTSWGLLGTFDGLGHTFKNFQIAGTNVSFFGRIDFTGSVRNTRFVNFRTRGVASFGLFDSTCYGVLDNLYIDGTCDSITNGGSLLGNFNIYNDSGAKLTNSTIYARTGSVVETSYGAMRSTSKFISTSGTTVYTSYAMPESFTTAGGTTEKLLGGEYFTLKVAADKTEDGAVNDNTFVKNVEGTSLTSVTLYGGKAATAGADLTSSSSLSAGKVTISSSALSSYFGKGIAIKVVTDSATEWFYTDIATYAITDKSDFSMSSFAIPKFARACGMTDFMANWSGYIILGNDVDFDGAAVQNKLPSANWGHSGRFGGTIDGRGYTLSNFSLIGNTASWRSLFGASNSSAVIKNLKITGYTRGSGLVGGLFEYCSALVDNVYIDCARSGNETQGSMFGWVQTDCRITNSTIIARDGTADSRVITISAAGTYTNSVIYTNADRATKVDGTNYSWGGEFKTVSEIPA